MFLRQVAISWPTGFIVLIIGSLACPTPFSDPVVNKTFFVWTATVCLVCAFFQGVLLKKHYSTYAMVTSWLLVGLSVLLVFPEIILWDSGQIGYGLSECGLNIPRFSFAVFACAGVRTLARLFVLMPAVAAYSGMRGAQFASDHRPIHLYWTLGLASALAAALLIVS